MNEKTLIEKIALRVLHDWDLEMENDLRKHGLRPGFRLGESSSSERKASLRGGAPSGAEPGLEGDDDGTD
jgi:hypothetical protein